MSDSDAFIAWVSNTVYAISGLLAVLVGWVVSLPLWERILMGLIAAVALTSVMNLFHAMWHRRRAPDDTGEPPSPPLPTPAPPTSAAAPTVTLNLNGGGTFHAKDSFNIDNSTHSNTHIGDSIKIDTVHVHQESPRDPNALYQGDAKIAATGTPTVDSHNKTTACFESWRGVTG